MSLEQTLHGFEIVNIAPHHINFAIDVPPNLTTFTHLLKNHIVFPFAFKLKNVSCWNETNNLARMIFRINGETFPKQSFRLYGIAEESTVQTVADVGGSLNDTYFLFYTISAEGAITNYYCWMNINAAGTDPAVAGATGIEVAGATNVTANTLATAIAAAIDALDNVGAGEVADLVTITNLHIGNVTNTIDSVVPTGFTFALITDGSSKNMTEENTSSSDRQAYFSSNLEKQTYELGQIFQRNWNVEFSLLNIHTSYQKIYILFNGELLFLKRKNGDCPLGKIE